MEPTGFERLIRRACRLEPDALQELVAHYSPRVYGLLFRLTGSRDTADDLLQETFLRMVRTISEYKHDGRFEAWLFRIAANLARDYLRQTRRRGKMIRLGDEERADVATLQIASAGHNTDAEKAAIGAEDQERLQGAMADLQDLDREIILLRHYSELSFNEIADLLNVPLGTALARAHRALKRLRKLLDDEV